MLALALILVTAPVAARATTARARHSAAAHAKMAGSSKAKAKPAHSSKVKPAIETRKSGSRQSRAAARKGHAEARPQTHPQVRPALQGRRRHGKAFREKSWPGAMQSVHLAMPPPLRGSHESLVHQNVMAEADGLERILDDQDLADRIAHGSLVPVPVSPALRINTDLPENRRYCRPWTAKFLTDLAKAHSAKFAATALEVTSAVRTVEYQRQLQRVNGNAAPADGDVASPHLTGGTIDLAKQGLSAKEIGWLRSWLLPIEQAGLIDVEEEFHQSCFHISVYKSYLEAKLAPPTTTRKPAGAPLSTASILPVQGR
jgi:hypothetical protein